MMLNKMQQFTPSSPTLFPNLTPGATLTCSETEYIRLQIPAGPAGSYRLAQLDDYQHLPRRDFSWHAPFELCLTARASSNPLPGTWGFGLWNDPFSMALPAGARALRLPALPNTAWFFYASSENFLSLRDDLPGHGSLAAVFRSPRWPGILLVTAIPFLPLLLVRPLARWLRRLGRRLVKETALSFNQTPQDAHDYRLIWETNTVQFSIDGNLVLETKIVPHGPLGLVIWVDNQYAAWQPDGSLKYGTLANPEAAWIEIQGLRINGQKSSIIESNARSRRPRRA